MEKEISFVCDKLEITRGELEDIFDLPLRTYADFKNKRSLIMFGAYLFRVLGLEKRYSENDRYIKLWRW